MFKATIYFIVKWYFIIYVYLFLPFVIYIDFLFSMTSYQELWETLYFSFGGESQSLTMGVGV